MDEPFQLTLDGGEKLHREVMDARERNGRTRLGKLLDALSASSHAPAGTALHRHQQEDRGAMHRLQSYGER